MHWLIQDNLFHEQGFQDLVQVLERLGIAHTLVEVLPGGAGTRPAVDVAGPVVVMGSLALTRYAKTRGWVPGAFFNDQFDFEVWREHLGAELLNADATVHRLAEVPERAGRFFLRPCLDGKAFTGKVLDWEEFARWREARLSSQEAGRLDANTRVALSAPKDIQREYRMVVVDGRVITGSLYKLGGEVVYSGALEPEVRAYAQRMAERWGPDRAYVVDLFMHDGTLFVGEYNTLNSAGFYAYNVGQMVAALEDMRFPDPVP